MPDAEPCIPESCTARVADRLGPSQQRYLYKQPYPSPGKGRSDHLPKEPSAPSLAGGGRQVSGKNLVGLVAGGGPRARPVDEPHREPVVRFLPRQAPEGPTRTQQAPRVERGRGKRGEGRGRGEGGGGGGGPGGAEREGGRRGEAPTPSEPAR